MKHYRHTSVQPESEMVEWKQSLGEWKEIVETCAAFATSKGGIVYVGVNPKGERVGVQIGQGTIEDLANKIKQNTDPSQYPAINIKGRENSAIIEINIEHTPVKPVWAFGRPIKRVGKTNQYLRRDEVQRLVESTTGRSWDAMICQRFAPKDVDKKVVRNYLERAGMNLTTPFEDVLKNLKMPTGSHGQCNAAVLLFGKSPQDFFIEAQVKCARFKGVDSVDFQDEQTYEGPILRQLNDAMGFVGRNTRRAYKITGRPEREVIPEYPEDAVREAIINALCHRNYAAVGTIQIRIYDNRLEVWNPGNLPHGLTLRKLYHRHASHPGNPLIAQALYRARLIEHWGTGTIRIIETCKEHGLKTEFAVESGFFIVTLRQLESPEPDHAKVALEGDKTQDIEQVTRQVTDQVADQVKKLLSVVRGSMTRAKLQATLRLKGRANFQALYLHPALTAGLVEMTIPDKPNSRLQKYRLTKKGQSVFVP